MNINWNVRLKNPMWWISLLAVIFTPVLSYMGITGEMLTSWEAVGEMLKTFVSTPYLILAAILAVLQFLGINTDPTTKGLTDSDRALSYDKPE